MRTGSMRSRVAWRSASSTLPSSISGSATASFPSCSQSGRASQRNASVRPTRASASELLAVAALAAIGIRIQATCRGVCRANDKRRQSDTTKKRTMCSRIERARRVCEYHRLIRLRCQSSSAACGPGHCVAAGRGLRTVVDRRFGGKAGLIPACSVIRRRTATGSAAGVERAKGVRSRQRQVIAGASAIARPSPSTWSQS